MKFLKIIIFLGLSFPLFTQAIGLSVKPSSLDLVLPSIHSKDLVITNISSEPITVNISADDFVSYITVSPNELRLLPDESSRVKIMANFNGVRSGVEQTNISIISRAVDPRSFNAASGIKIPLTINIVKKYWQWSGEMIFLAVFFALLMLILSAQLVFLIFKAKAKRSKWLPINFLKIYRQQFWHKLKKRFFK